MDFRFGEESLAGFLLHGVLGAKSLHCDRPLELDIRGVVNDRHAAFTKGFTDQVTIARGCFRPLVRLDEFERVALSRNDGFEVSGFFDGLRLGWRTAISIFVSVCHRPSPNPTVARLIANIDAAVGFCISPEIVSMGRVR